MKFSTKLARTEDDLEEIAEYILRPTSIFKGDKKSLTVSLIPLSDHPEKTASTPFIGTLNGSTQSRLSNLTNGNVPCHYF